MQSTKFISNIRHAFMLVVLTAMVFQFSLLVISLYCEENINANWEYTEGNQDKGESRDGEVEEGKKLLEDFTFGVNNRIDKLRLSFFGGNRYSLSACNPIHEEVLTQPPEVF